MTTDSGQAGTGAATVRDVTYGLLRAQGLTTVFGNVGSTEETFLAELVQDLRVQGGAAVGAGVLDGLVRLAQDGDDVAPAQDCSPPGPTDDKLAQIDRRTRRQPADLGLPAIPAPRNPGDPGRA